MSDATTERNRKMDGDRFPSLAALREANNDLLKRHREHDTPSLLTDIEQFMAKGQAAGAVIDDDEDRWTAQSILDYWGSLLYRAGHEPPDATLIEFDPMLAPALDDSLCPYMGLDAFRQDTHAFFFGRQRLIDRLIHHLESHRFLIVVGSSGSGKSSLVLGGVLPRLSAGALPDSETWRYYDPMVPGSDPLMALARRLQPNNQPNNQLNNQASAPWISQQIEGFKDEDDYLMQLVNHLTPHPAVLVVDQFEEVFTLCRDEAMRTAFINNLLTLAQAPNARHTLILTMRTDFESQLVRNPQLLALFEQFHFRVTALDSNELHETIAKPAELVGLKFEDGLVDALASDVLGEPAALPLLQFTLLQLWSNRERNRVTWEAYRRLGGGRLALAKSADQFYEGLIPEEQQTVKRILLSMVRPTEGLEVTSNRILRQDLYRSGEAGDRIDRVLTKLTQARLIRLTEGVNPEDTQVEVAHEAIIRNWPRLIDWLEDERTKLRERYRLTDAANKWESKSRDNSLLARGTLLQEFQHYTHLNKLETEFIDRSQESEKRKKIFWTALLTLFLGLLSLVVSIAFWSNSKIEQANAETAREKANKEKEINEAVKQERARLRQEIATLEQQKYDLKQQKSEDERELQKTTEDLDQAKSKIQDVEKETQLVKIELVEERDQLISLQERQQLARDEAQSAIGEAQRAQQQRDEALDEAQAAINEAEIAQQQRDEALEDLNEAEKLQIKRLIYSPDSTLLLTLNTDGKAQIWDAVTGEIKATLDDPQSKILSATFSPDSQNIVVTGGKDGIVRSWDQFGNPIRTFLGHELDVTDVDFSPMNSRFFATTSLDQTLRIWNINSETEITFRLFEAALTGLVFSPDSPHIVASTVHGDIHKIAIVSTEGSSID